MRMVFQQFAHTRFMKSYIDQSIGSKMVDTSSNTGRAGLGYTGAASKKLMQWGPNAPSTIMFTKGETLEPQTARGITVSSTSKQQGDDAKICWADIDFEDDDKQIIIWEKLNQMDLAKW